MNIKVFKTYDELSVATADMIASQIKSKRDSLLCLASGESPTGALARLSGYAKLRQADFSKCRFIGLDEWVGMDKTDEGSCQHYVFNHFFYPAGINPQNITFFDARAKDLTSECNRINNFLETYGPIDLVLVGVGLNGHVGLNEPGSSSASDAHVVNLEKSTTQVAQKYFSRSTVLDRGITLGLRQLLASKTLVLIASGEKKADVIQKIVEGPVTDEVPASHLQKHSNCHVFVDAGAASKIKVI
jgi:glucosamine-6-phosphate isomerase